MPQDFENESAHNSLKHDQSCVAVSSECGCAIDGSQFGNQGGIQVGTSVPRRTCRQAPWLYDCAYALACVAAPSGKGL